ncbi:putative phosphatase regulatory subunit-domain-containing protein, partial [Dioszegia hungarica]
PETSRSSTPSTAQASLIPLHVLPEVRSPPRRSLAMAADSLQLNLRRGRRPRLFGFTEIPDSGSSASSAASSVNNSRSNSPERKGASPLGLTLDGDGTGSIGASISIPSGPGPGSVLPRRGPVRAHADDHIMLTPRRARDNGLKLDFTGITPLTSPIDPASTYIPSPYSAKLIRKKSGELVKPALKYGGPLTASGTPMAVHFDSQLERVKLFNKDHKPQVVSRDGSPTQYTTSEGEEFPFPSTDDEAATRSAAEERKVLSIKLPNFPSSPNTFADLQLESLYLDESDRKTLRGVIVVKNFAFNKWVAVRFTLDWWQTTSEVSASHKETIREGAYDRFSFAIKLGDVMAKIEEKTLFMCVRYNSEGREIWDSNNGENYQVNFERKAAAPVAVDKASLLSPGLARGGGKRMMNQWGGVGKAGKDDDRMASLREKLSRLTAEDDEMNAVPQLSPNRSSYLSAGKRGVNFGGSPNSSPRKGFAALADLDPAQGIPSQALAARYDFGSAFKGAREGRSASPDSRNAELPNVRTGLLAFEPKGDTPTRPERPGMDYYSPRYSPKSPLPVPASATSSAIGILPTPLEVPDVTVQGPSPPPPDSPIATISHASGSTTKSPTRPTFGRSSTSPALITTSLPHRPSSVRPPSSPLARSPALPPSSPTALPTSRLAMSGSRSPSPPILGMSTSGSGDSMASYSSFIEQFCWGGGSSTTPTPTSSNEISPPRRTHSSSSLDEYFAHSSSTASMAGGSGLATPRAPSGRQGPEYGAYGESGMRGYVAAQVK